MRTDVEDYKFLIKLYTNLESRLTELTADIASLINLKAEIEWQWEQIKKGKK